MMQSIKTSRDRDKRSKRGSGMKNDSSAATILVLAGVFARTSFSLSRPLANAPSLPHRFHTASQRHSLGFSSEEALKYTFCAS